MLHATNTDCTLLTLQYLQTGRKVIISSYNTFKRRCFGAEVYDEKDIGKSRDLMKKFGRHINLTATFNARLLNVDGELLDGDESDATSESEQPDHVDSSSDEDTDEEYMEQLGNEANQDEEPLPEDQIDDEDTTQQGELRQRAKKKGRLFFLKPEYDFMKFSVVVCDEAQLLKSTRSSIHKMVKYIPRQSLILCTATPMLNKPGDILGYLLLAWPEADANPVPNGFSYATLYSKKAQILGLDPEQKLGETDFFTSNDNLMTMLNDDAVASKDHPACQPFLSRIQANSRAKPLIDMTNPEQAHAMSDGRLPWLINPGNFQQAIKEFGFDFDACRMIVQTALDQLLVKRGMQSTLTLPDGKLVAPGDSIPGAIYREVRVYFRKRDEYDYHQQVFLRWKKYLYVRGKDSEGEEGSEGKAQSSEGQDQGSEGKAQRGNKINTNAWRQCSLPAVNLDNMQLLRPNVENAALAQELKIGPAENGKFKPSRVPMGTHETNKLAAHKDGGALFVHALLRNAPNEAKPRTRYDFLYFLIYRSPIMCATVRQIEEWVSAPPDPMAPECKHRVVVMGMSPWVLQ